MAVSTALLTISFAILWIDISLNTLNYYDINRGVTCLSGWTQLWFQTVPKQETSDIWDWALHGFTLISLVVITVRLLWYCVGSYPCCIAFVTIFCATWLVSSIWASVVLSLISEFLSKIFSADILLVYAESSDWLDSLNIILNSTTVYCIWLYLWAHNNLSLKHYLFSYCLGR